MGTTTIRVSTATRDGLREVARSRSMTVAQATAHGLTLLRQEQIGRDLAAPLTDDEIDWLDADAG